MAVVDGSLQRQCGDDSSRAASSNGNQQCFYQWALELSYDSYDTVFRCQCSKFSASDSAVAAGSTFYDEDFKAITSDHGTRKP